MSASSTPQSKNELQRQRLRRLLAKNRRLRSELSTCKHRIFELEEGNQLLVAHAKNIARDADRWHTMLMLEYEQSARTREIWREFKERREAEIDKQL
jgi:hypothetical protein